MQYSLKKGLTKGLISGLTVFLSTLVVLGIADIDIWAFLELHLKPLLAGLTFGGLVTMAINFLKVQSK